MSWTAIIFLSGIALCMLPFVLVVAYMYLIVPLRIRRTNTTPAHPIRRETTDADLTAEMRSFMDSALGAFARAGYCKFGSFTRFDKSGKRVAIVALLRNPTRNDRAEVIGVWVKGLRNLTFRIVSRFPDGRQVITASARVLPMFPRNPNSQTVNFPWVRDAGVLAEAHRRRLVQLGRDTSTREGIGGLSDLEYFDRAEAEELQRIARTGFFKLDPKTDSYVQTIGSAYLTVWKMLPPISKIRWALAKRRARRAWRALKMDEVAAAATGNAEAVPEVDVSLSERSARELRYRARLQFGEVETDRMETSLTIRMGGPSRGMVVRQNVLSLIWMGALLAILGFVGMRWWNWYWSMRGLPPALRAAFRPPLPGLWFWVSIAFLVIDAMRFTYRLVMARDDAEISASHAGLRFSGASGWPRDGFVPRDQIEWLLVIPRLSWPKRAAGLRVRFAQRSVILLVGPSQERMVEVREQLLDAMGIALDRQG